MTWDELVALEVGTVVADWTSDNIRCLVIRNHGSLCAYLGVYNGHPLAGYHYDNIDLYVHGGLTFADAPEYEGAPWPRGYYFYGWDYAHMGDYFMFYDDPEMKHIFASMPSSLAEHRLREKKWGLQDVMDEMFDVLPEFKKLANKAKRFVKQLGTIYNLTVLTGILITALFFLILFL